MLKKIMIASMTSVTLIACTATTASIPSFTPPQANLTISASSNTQSLAGQEITLEKIMSDPDWIGRSPENGFWNDASDGVLFYRKREGSHLNDLYQRPLSAQDNGQLVALSERHKVEKRQMVYNADRSKQAYVYQGNIFVLAENGINQVTLTRANESQPVFLNDGRLAYRKDNSFYAVDLSTGLTVELATLKTEDEPKGISAPEDYLAKEEHKLIQYVANKHQQAIETAEAKEQLEKENASIAPSPFYLGKGMSIVNAQLSPRGDRILVSVQTQKDWRQEGDIMPNYIGQDGRIKAEKVRSRVADAKPSSQTLYVLDLKSGEQHPLSFDTLPGFDEDVLAAVKAENAQRIGQSYKSKKAPRDINLLWTSEPIKWNPMGDQVAVMLEAWDNKDRWIATVDFDKNEFVTQHRLHDDAWVNYAFNTFAWLNKGDSLYYLSEQSGYSQLYVKPLNGKEKALTAGQFVVDNVTLTKDDAYFYFTANRKHPGIYEVYRVATTTGEIEALTDLNGQTNYQLSPDESKLLLEHSKVLMPPELYVQDATSGAPVTRLTHTVSDEFLSMPWTAPDIVPVKSSHTTQPIYAKVYQPKDSSAEKRRAVMFVHGAGYLQNSHLGWSGYFREFMFHSMLAQQGYVVMDMDYRASKGYGRDWRTAIYRDMGRPEVNDLIDGVNWLAANANVDEKRIGVYGGSYGGFLTFMSLFLEPELFQSGAALRPVSDWAHYNDGYTSNILNRPDVDPIAYERSSPIYHVKGLNKPLLINAPMIDDNVFFQDVVRIVQVMIEMEKENFETAIFPVEPHGFVQPSSWLDEYRRIYKLFEETL